MKQLTLTAIFLLFLLVACEGELPPPPPPPGGEVMAGRAGFNIPGTMPSWSQPASGAISINKDTFFLGDDVIITADVSDFSGRTAVWGTLYRLKSNSWKSVKAEEPRSLDKGWSLIDETEWQFDADEVGMKYALIYICLGEPWQCGGKYQLIAYKVEQRPVQATPTPQPTVQPTATPVVTATPLPTASPAGSPSPTPVATATPTTSPVSTASPTPTPSPTTIPDEYVWNEILEFPIGSEVCSDSVSINAICASSQENVKCKKLAPSTGYQCIKKPTPTPSATPIPTPTPIQYAHTWHKTGDCGSALTCNQQGLAECAPIPTIGGNCQQGAKCYYCHAAGNCAACTAEQSYLECTAECATVCDLFECAI